MKVKLTEGIVNEFSLPRSFVGKEVTVNDVNGFHLTGYIDEGDALVFLNVLDGNVHQFVVGGEYEKVVEGVPTTTQTEGVQSNA